VRLWSLHPSLLDRQGLIACWREALLAQAVLLGRTKGYLNHPQLVRFRATGRSAEAIAAYLDGLAHEGEARGYRLDRTRIHADPRHPMLTVTAGQLGYERDHLYAKLLQRAPDAAPALLDDRRLQPHPLFSVVPGPVEAWERISDED
jgi:Pyrimidine dimer DNA glycosylase